MKRVFAFEYPTGGGPADGDEGAVQPLRPVAVSMRDVVVGDFLRAGGSAGDSATR